MCNTNVSFNKNLIQLTKKLNLLGIKATTNNNILKIEYNDNNKAFIFSMLSLIDNCKTGFEFNALKNGDKAVSIEFERGIDTSCSILISYLNSEKHVYIESIFDRIDYIQNLLRDEANISIQKNMDIKNCYILSISQQLTRSQIDSKSSFVFHNKALSAKLIHTISQISNDDKHNVTYRLLYNNDDELDNLITSINKRAKVRTLSM